MVLTDVLLELELLEVMVVEVPLLLEVVVTVVDVKELELLAVLVLVRDKLQV